MRKRGVVLYSTQIEVRDIQHPGISPGQVLVQVKAAGVCGSDLHLWRERHSWRIKLPLVLGHEFCDLVAEVGACVSGFEPGDRVVSETAAEICGRCAFCLSGSYNVCPQRKGFGALVDGAFTHYVPVRPQILHRIPENVSFEVTALAEPIAVAYSALVEKTPVRPGDVVVIQGPGMIGLMALLLARLRGAGALVVLGTEADQHRLSIARSLGATHSLNIDREDALPVVQELSRGLGADLVVDCTGVSAALRQALQLVRPNGQITKIGWGPQALDFSLDPLVAKAVTLQGAFSHTYPTWERVLGLLGGGQLDVKPVIGGAYSLAEWEQAFSAMEDGVNVKSVLVTDDS